MSDNMEYTVLSINMVDPIYGLWKFPSDEGLCQRLPHFPYNKKTVGTEVLNNVEGGRLIHNL